MCVPCRIHGGKIYLDIILYWIGCYRELSRIDQIAESTKSKKHLEEPKQPRRWKTLSSENVAVLWICQLPVKHCDVMEHFPGPRGSDYSDPCDPSEVLKVSNANTIENDGQVGCWISPCIYSDFTHTPSRFYFQRAKTSGSHGATKDGSTPCVALLQCQRVSAMIPRDRRWAPVDSPRNFIKFRFKSAS